MFETPQGMSPFTFEPIARYAENNAQTLATLNGSMVQAMAGCSREMFDLIGERSKAYAHLPAEMAACSNAQDLVALQGRFMESMLQHYQSHASKMSTLMTSLWMLPAKATATPIAAQRESPAPKKSQDAKKVTVPAEKAA